MVLHPSCLRLALGLLLLLKVEEDADDSLHKAQLLGTGAVVVSALRVEHQARRGLGRALVAGSPPRLQDGEETTRTISKYALELSVPNNTGTYGEFECVVTPALDSNTTQRRDWLPHPLMPIPLTCAR